MKFPNPLQQFLRPKKLPEVFLSLVLNPNGVATSAWYIDTANAPHSLGHAQSDVAEDTWEVRTEAADRAIAAVEEKLDESTEIHKVVLGLPTEYLTKDGDIDPSVRKEIKHLTQSLDLTPIGFVPIHQALVYKFKRDEGMPPTVILIGLTNSEVDVHLYKVGSLVDEQTGSRGENLAESLEGILKSFTELEVLPSRILLYGMDEKLLEGSRAELLRHPWPTKANFLHFPKIEVIEKAEITSAVTLAGASELAVALGEEPTSEQEVPVATHPPETEENVEEALAREKELRLEETEKGTDETNVTVVSPEELGFAKEDILEKEERRTEQSKKRTDEAPQKKFALPFAIPKIRFKIPRLPALPVSLSKIPLRGGVLPGIIMVGLIILFAVANWFLPKATVTILAVPQVVNSSITVSVDPTAAVADSQNKIIPGHIREDTMSGDKTIPVTGTKKVGDPAKGSITIYNKTLSSRVFKKGSILSSSGLKFTLDSDVQVASASESIGSITFGKNTDTVTAAAIGPESNLAAGLEFTFQDFDSAIAVARNDQVFAGGTSRQVTVVSRSDYDELVKELTDELLKEAKTKLTASISGSEKLIDQTIVTTVKEKTFAQELDQEAKELSGKITILVSGTSYNEGDLATIFRELTKDKLQSGYSFVPERIEVTTQNVTIKKGGKITLAASIKGVALPTITGDVLRKAIAGKNLTQAQEYLKGVLGVGGAEFRFRWSLFRNQLPLNSNNISLTVAVQE